jgi:hypothetical protein
MPLRSMIGVSIQPKVGFDRIAARYQCRNHLTSTPQGSVLDAFACVGERQFKSPQLRQFDGDLAVRERPLMGRKS